MNDDSPVSEETPSTISALDGFHIGQGDFVILLMQDQRRLTVRAIPGAKGTHFGQVNLGALVGLRYGTAIRTNTGAPIYLLRPTLQDHIMTLKRITQIIYPKDIGTILLKLGIRTGSRVLECGTGSGALTLALAWMVGPTGKIFTYERDPQFQARAKYNLERVGLLDRVEMKLRDLGAEGFDERHIDAVFLDVREPPEVLSKVSEALTPGGMLGILVPTANQVCQTLEALTDAPYIDTEVLETLFRKYKVNAHRFRPEDRMIGHTGYLIFSRRIDPVPDFTVADFSRVMPVKKKAAIVTDAPPDTGDGNADTGEIESDATSNDSPLEPLTETDF